MNGVQGLAEAIRIGIKNLRSKQQEQKAVRGTIQGDRFCTGFCSYPFKAAVDCNTDEGSLVWAVISQGGTAVIVGA